MSFSFLATVFLLAQAGAATPAATAAGTPGAQAPSAIGTFVPFIFMAIIFYFVLIRPQQKRQKEMQALLGSIKNNDKVVTTSGIHGVVTQVKERTVVLRVDEGVKLEFEKSAVATVLKKSEPAAAEAPAKS